MTKGYALSQDSSYTVKLLAIAFVITSLVFAAAPAKTHAAVLTHTQIQSVTSLLNSFGTNATTLQTVGSTLLGATTATVAPIPVDVFLVAGQSNAEGLGNSAQSPVPPAGVVLQYYNGKVYDAVDPVGNAFTGSAWPEFGIEYNALTGHDVVFVPTAVGGTSMTVQADTGVGNWGPTTGTLFNNSISQEKAAMAALVADGYAPTFQGVLWGQGEADGFAIQEGILPDASLYQSTFINMIAQYRAQLGPTMPFYIFKSGEQSNFPISVQFGYTEIQQAQDAVAATVPNVSEVFTDAVNYPAEGLMQPPPDVWHYTQAGYNKMGMIGAQGVVAHLPPAPVLAPTVSYTTPGTYTFVVPAGLQSLTAAVNGGGGAGVGCFGVNSSATPEYGTAGGASSFNGNVIGNGGANDGTTPGTASGGDTNTAGGAGDAASFNNYPQCDGLTHATVTSNGGRAVKTYNASTLVPGTSVTIVVGAGGVGKSGGTFDAASGGNGSVLITYTTAGNTTSSASKKIFLTSGSTWTVPSDWNSASNTIEVIGSGANGASGIARTSSGGGGGGGAYAKIANLSLTSGATVNYQVGSGGSDTYFNGIGTTCSTQSVCAKGGGSASNSGGIGGSALSSIGTVTRSGGAGSNANGNAAGGGGAAASSFGAGAMGTAALSDHYAGNGGASASGAAGGLGGNPSGSTNPTSGSNGSDFDNTHGAGAGGGGGAGSTGGLLSGCSNGAAGGLYGAGAGGGGATGQEGCAGAGGAGGQGLIVISYIPTTNTTPSTVSSTSPLPTCTMSASPASIVLGQSIALTWSSSNATSALLNGTSVSVMGTQTVTPSATGTIAYTMNVSAASGSSSCNASVRVQILAPTPVVGTQNFTTPGTYTFVVPTGLQSLTATVNGGGGAGVGCVGVLSSATPEYGTAGGASSFNGNVIGNGGANDGTTPGTASGGDTNTAGGAANIDPSSNYPQCDGFAHAVVTSNGGRAVKSYTGSTLTPGSTITVVVGAGGVGKSGGTFDAASGGNGSVLITYTTLTSSTALAGKSNVASVIASKEVIPSFNDLLTWFGQMLIGWGF